MVLELRQAVLSQCENVSAFGTHCRHHPTDQAAHLIGSARSVLWTILQVIIVSIELSAVGVAAVDLTYHILQQ